ncbi:MAG: hypothetical protein J4445_01645 [DPANN group archaeon]|nr:hypothetical protein [DPANN group archaeon]
MVSKKPDEYIITALEGLQRIILELKSTKGLINIIPLNDLDKLEFKVLEDSNNFGVGLSLQRKYALIVIHDSNFRPPVGTMIIKDDNTLIFPPLPFPEVKAWNVISGSPSVVLHNHIINRFNLNLTSEHATLIIGFDL